MDIATLKTIKSNFVKELQDSASGKKTSLPFIINQIPTTPLVNNGEIFQALVIGGSIYKKAILKKVKKKLSILEIENGEQPLFKTAEDLFLFVGKIANPNINIISINFAHRIKPTVRKNSGNSSKSRIDGILIGGSKESTLHGLIDKKVREEIERYFRKNKKDALVAVANDTICLLLAGLTQYKPIILAGGADGTGTNFAFFLDKKNAVNLESANFDKFPQSKEGKIIDSTSSNRGGWIFEKETSGAYLYKHFNLIIKERNIDYPQISSTEELDLVSRKNIPQVSEIANNLLKRSAQLVSCQIAGITEFKKRGMVFNMEGSLFWKANGYKETVEETVKQLIPQYKVKFVEIKDSGILGAAKLVS